MTNTVNKRKVNMPAGMKHKMMAAVSMLVVSSIMVVSSTYAWFTLSTAPEVTGITTNVGANGNLEMALLNDTTYKSTAEDLSIESNVGDSMATVGKNVAEANETWGNLVDLSDASYALSQVVLTPARLNLTTPVGTTDTAVGNTILMAPSYGNDGRVINIDKETVTGRYDSGWVYDADKAGVRVIGTSTGVTKRISAYRNALTTRTNNVSAAKSAALKSLSDNGQTLASMMVAYVQDPNVTYTKAEVTALQNIITALGTANGYAGTAVKNAVLAYTLSAANTNELSDDQVAQLVSAVESASAANIGTTVSTYWPENTAEDTYLPAGASAAITQWSTNETTINSAKTNVEALLANDSDSYTYTEIQTVLNGLVDKEHTTIAGITNPHKDNLGEIVNYVTANGAVDIVMLDGSGIYADVAKLVGDYSLSGMKVTVNYSGSDVSLNAAMATKVIDGKTVTSSLVDGVAVGNAPEASPSGAGTVVTISDTYGYALDFGFRTNAAASDLLLQTEAKQRVYDGNSGDGTEKTQGGGSTMTFNSDNTRVFSVEEVRALMSAVRVVFVTPSSTGYDILGVAAPEITASTDNGTGITTYTGGTTINNNGEDVADDVATGIKANLYLYNYTKGSEGELTLTGKKLDSNGKEDGTLTNLNQNVAKKVTAIVYLDGDIVDNTMVANAANSMSGKLNLQFSSSATLVPMENSTMRAGGTTQVEVSYTEVAVAGASYSYVGKNATVKAGYTIYKGSDGEAYYKADGTDTYVKITATNASTALDITVSDSDAAGSQANGGADTQT